MLKISKAALLAAALSLTAVPAAGLLTASSANAALATTNVQQGHDESSSSSEPSSPSPETTTSTTGFSSSLSIPTITAVDSSMDEAALRDALSGGFGKHVDEIARLNATSITIPEITLTMNVTADGIDAPVTTTMSYKDVVLSNVKNGVAESASVGSAESTSPSGSFKFGKVSMAALDFGSFLALYSFVPNGGDEAMKTLYKNLSFEGGSFESPEASCSFGKVSADEFQARPLKVSFAAMMAAAQEMDAAKGSTPPAEAVTTFVTFLTDVFQAFKSTPLSLDGLNCSGKGNDGKPFEFKIGGITMDGYAPGVYPAISIKDVSIGSGPDSISVAAATFKSTDLSQPIKAVQDNTSNLSPDWFEKNYRKLIPAFAGFSFSGLAMDIPDSEHPGERIKANIGDFDLSLSDYFNGIPTRISSKASGVVVPLPENSTDDSVKMLMALGITKVNVGFDFDASWDKATQSINIGKVAVSGVDLGSFSLASVIGNAAEQLFDVDPNVQQAAGLNVTVKSITLDTKDDGLGDKLVPTLAQQQGVSDPAAFRTQMAGMAEGAALQMLGSTDAARALGVAVGNFISGKAKTLSINIAAKDPNGVAIPLLMQASNDPTALVNTVDITGSNPVQ